MLSEVLPVGTAVVFSLGTAVLSFMAARNKKEQHINLTFFKKIRKTYEKLKTQ